MNRFASKQKKIKSLIIKHKRFDNMISKAFNGLSIDTLIVTNLKKKKLWVRDQIHKLTKL